MNVYRDELAQTMHGSERGREDGEREGEERMRMHGGGERRGRVGVEGKELKKGGGNWRTNEKLCMAGSMHNDPVRIRHH